MEDVLDEIYQYLDRPQRYDKYIACLCPFHNDTRPSFFIYEQTYKCSACGVYGKTKNLLTDLQSKHGVFLAKKEKSFRSPWTNWEDRYGSLDSTLDHAHRNLLDHNKTAYLYKRGIELETIKALRIGWMDDWITFPIYDAEHEIIGATARAGETNKTSSKYCNIPNMNPNTLYIPDHEMIKYKSIIYLVYGILDTVSLYQLGYASASTTTGKRIDPSAFDDIRKRITIIPDEGEEIDAVWLSTRLGWRGSVMKMVYPDGTKDCNDLMVRRKDYLLAILEGNHGDNDYRSK